MPGYLFVSACDANLETNIAIIKDTAMVIKFDISNSSMKRVATAKVSQRSRLGFKSATNGRLVSATHNVPAV